MPNYDVVYTDVDLNTDATTTLYDASSDATVYAVHLPNGGSNAVIQLEVTDGSDTVVLTPDQTASDNIRLVDPHPVDGDSDLQANVTTVEGSSLTETAAVFVGG